MGALRDHDRNRQGEATRASGNPGQRGASVTAFRLVGMSPGSAVLTLVPEPPAPQDHPRLPLDDDGLPLAVQNLQSLVRAIDKEGTIAPDVLAALDDARRAGGEDGSWRIALPRRWAAAHAETVIDAAAIARHRSEREHTEDGHEERSISGYLHSIDLDPDQVFVRTYDDTDWRCHYPAELEPDVAALLGRVVVVQGTGHMTGPRRGTMEVRHVEAAFPEGEYAPDDMAAIPAAPQGLAAIAGDWVGDEEDERYLAALLERQ